MGKPPADKHYNITDQGDLRKYRTELPNMIDDLDLSVYAFRLYVHLKRVAGANGGTCYQGTRKLAESCRMSVGQVSKAKKELLDRGLIVITPKNTHGGHVDDIAIVDIWDENFRSFSVHNTNTNDDTSVQDTNTNLISVQDTNSSVHHTNTKCSPHELKKEHGRKNHEEEREGEIEKQITHTDVSSETTIPETTEETTEERETSYSPAVALYFEFYPSQMLGADQIAEIDNRISDLHRWHRALTYWKRNRYRPQSITKMCDRYDEELNHTNGTSNGTGKPHLTAADENARKVLEAQEARYQTEDTRPPPLTKEERQQQLKEAELVYARSKTNPRQP